MVAMETSYSPFLLKWESEPRQYLQFPSLFHLSPSLTLSGCHWESCQLLFFISKRSIDGLLAPACSFSIFCCSLGRSVATQAASRVHEICRSQAHPFQTCRSLSSCGACPAEAQFDQQQSGLGVCPWSTPCWPFSSMKRGCCILFTTAVMKDSGRIILERLWLIQNEKIRCF